VRAAGDNPFPKVACPLQTEFMRAAANSIVSVALSLTSNDSQLSMCDEETRLWVSEQPICVKCDDELERRKALKADPFQMIRHQKFRRP
jgi:hypothetical protein